MDSEEARWLREAEAQQIWRKLGFSTALEYLEDVFGYAPRTALERLRVAKELGRLKQLDARLHNGELSFAAARELSRVMTPQTERAWLARARGRNLRDIEELVAGHKKGDGPDDPKDPNAAPRVVSLRLTPAMAALLRQTRADLSDECGHHVEDDELIEVLCRRARDVGECREGAPAPAYQVSIRTCDQCGAGAQLGGGSWTPIDDAAVGRATCDAIVNGHEADLVTRGSRTIPKKVRDHVWLRDGGRCRFPGCRATRNCDLHHIVPWADGGGHEPWNLVIACSGHHKLLHEGLLSIAGRAPDALVFTRDGEPVLDPRRAAKVATCTEVRTTDKVEPTAADRSPRQQPPSRFGHVARQIEARAALRELGYTKHTAKEAVERACAHVDATAGAAMLVAKVRDLDRKAAPEPAYVPPHEPAPTRTPRAAYEREVEHASELSTADRAELATSALVTSGFKRATATRAVAAALRQVPATRGLAALLREALRHCANS